MRLRAEHYKHYIEGQNDSALTMHVLRLKKEQKRLIKKIEAGHYGKPRKLIENEAQKVNRYRWYIQDTLSALERMEKTFVLDAQEKNALQFQKNIPYISHLNFYIGGYLNGLEKYEIKIEQAQAYINYSLSNTSTVPPMILMEPDYLSKKDFLAFIHSLYMGEWQSDYSTIQDNFWISENIVWRVEVYYSNGAEKQEYGGINAFPYNFYHLLSFFEAYKKTVDKI